MEQQDSQADLGLRVIVDYQDLKEDKEHLDPREDPFLEFAFVVKLVLKVTLEIQDLMDYREFRDPEVPVELLGDLACRDYLVRRAQMVVMEYVVMKVYQDYRVWKVHRGLMAETHLKVSAVRKASPVRRFQVMQVDQA